MNEHDRLADESAQPRLDDEAILAALVEGSHRHVDGLRCGTCGHPLSAATWEDGFEEVATAEEVYLEEAIRALRAGEEPEPNLGVHFSACDEQCEHAGPGRLSVGDGWREVGDLSRLTRIAFRLLARRVEAAWRPPVTVRATAPADAARSGRSSALCLRCSLVAAV